MPEAPARFGCTATATQTRTFAADPGGVAEADDWIGAIGQGWGWSEKTAFAARLCVAELFANVLEHGRATPDDRVTVSLLRCTDGVGVVFADTSAPFDPTAAVAPERAQSIEGATIAGRGLMLVHNYASDMAYRRDAGGNHLTFFVAAR